ncbi:MAG: leucyl aminopeptidase [Chromatiales bacterium]|jgi:leucyl aminopeptidase|nr:leucyl aminopeptidase [Chromatiales bacterium]MDH4014286.1 leucyl aminopeptidase [Chromatiales bacterium]
MQFHATSGAPARQKTDCAIVGIFEKQALSPAAAELDKASKGAISKVLAQGDISGKRGETLLLRHVAGLNCVRLILTGLGKQDEYDAHNHRRALAAAMKLVAATSSRDALSFLGWGPADKSEFQRIGRDTLLAAHTAVYRFTEMKSGRSERQPKLDSIGIGVPSRSAANAAQTGAEEGASIAAGMLLSQDLANLPANVCTPTYLATTAKKLARQHRNLRAEVFSEADMKRLKMGALLSVTRGTQEPAKLVVLHYKGAQSQAPVVLVGKGITFDAGGISLKPPQAMDEMKFDMSGAASVLGCMHAVASLKLPINLIVIVPACENLPSGLATKPGDIVRSMSGKTIEILNTDAEGRLILCDALTYARRFKPSIVIDVATLTGACVIALGGHLTGLMSPDDQLAADLLAAGERIGDRAWRLPLSEEYHEGLKSNFADFANVGGREGGAITAGCFLSKFTEGMTWAHLDIAGTAWKSGAQKGSTGRPVPLLVEYLMERVR